MNHRWTIEQLDEANCRGLEWVRAQIKEGMVKSVKAHLNAHPDRMLDMLHAISRLQPGDSYYDEDLGFMVSKPERSA